MDWKKMESFIGEVTESRHFPFGGRKPVGFTTPDKAERKASVVCPDGHAKVWVEGQPTCPTRTPYWARPLEGMPILPPVGAEEVDENWRWASRRDPKPVPQ